MIDSSVKVTIPSTVNLDQKASEIMVDAVVDQAMTIFSELFGGATATPSKGAYLSEDGTLVKEDVIVVESLCPKQDAHFRADSVMDLGAQICEVMKQECVLVQIDGVAHFVDVSHRIPHLCGTLPMPVEK